MSTSTNSYETPFPAPRLSFELHDAPAASTSARTGTLSFAEDSKTLECLDTPCIIQYTKKGNPVHLTRDNVDRLPINAVAVCIEHLCVVGRPSPKRKSPS